MEAILSVKRPTMELTISEQLLYSTVKLSSSKGGKSISTGTGFFVELAEQDGRCIPCVVTNKHVVAGADTLYLTLHFSENSLPSGKFATCNILLTPKSIIMHPHDVDLCAIPVGDIFNQGLEKGTPFFFMSLPLALVPPDEDWQLFDAIENVTMIGCPRGIIDEVNNFPVVRQGITATQLSKLYNGKAEFMVDMACFPGSSGSPIFVYDRNGFFDRKSNSFMMGSTRILLVGILYSGPLVTNDGRIELTKKPSISINTMMHLGNAIRSTELKILDDECVRIMGRALPPSSH